MSRPVAGYARRMAGLKDKKAQSLAGLVAPELSAPWLPNSGPQAEAFRSQADLLLYGGAAGGGKTDLLLGLALTRQARSVIFRRAYVDLAGVEERLLEITGSRQGWRGDKMTLRRDGRLVELGALEKPGAEKSWQGRPHDFIGFDEGAQLSEAKVRFVLGWLRSTEPGRRCRSVIASNPPMGGEGDWLVRWFAPWLDPMHPDAAEPGELRWSIERDGDTVWVQGPDPVVVDGDVFAPQSRTFIPARLDDNPYLSDTGYRGRLQNLPEPLRSQLLKGDFLAGREDHDWQVIPSAWVSLANQRWARAEARTSRRPMLALACDVALGGADDTAISRLHADGWFAPIVRVKGAECREPAEVAALMLRHQKDGCDLCVDGTGGWGSGVKALLEVNHGLDCASIVFSAASSARTSDGKLGFRNQRAEMWWRLREALDPDGGEGVMLPPDARLSAELTAPRYRVRGTDILIEDKDEIRRRLGSSTDGADAVVMAWRRRAATVRSGLRLEPPRPRVGAGWMGR